MGRSEIVGDGGDGKGVVVGSSLENRVQNYDSKKDNWDWKKEILENRYMSPIQKQIIERLHDTSYARFSLDPSFVSKYSRKDPGFGFSGLGELVYMRTYSRIKEDGSNERWHETIQRVIEGTYNLQKRWVTARGLEWSDYKAQESAQEMYDRMFNMKFLPPGRGLWAMGSEVTEERGLYAALNNCAFVSTENIREDLAKPFTFLMEMSMLGVGVGFDTKGEGQLIVKGPDKRRDPEHFTIPDTREGWTESVRRLIESYFLGISPIVLDYSQIRPEGQLINGFGGKASGPEPLKRLHTDLAQVLEKNIDRPISATAIVDIQNLIGKCVVAGNVRRTAEIAFGDPESEEFLDLKNYSVNPSRATYGWASNNSVFAKLGMDYGEIAERIRINGEPGLAWLENMQNFGRLGDSPNFKDKKARGANPCMEQTLEHFELCNLVETFPFRHKSKDDFLRTLKFAYLYAKTVSLGETHWPETNRVLLRNRRIGCSISGVAQFLGERGIGEMRAWLREGYEIIQHYDEVYSNWLTIPRSIKTTSVKPSGTVSLLAGATPGSHFPASEYYIRRMRLGRNSELVEPLKDAGYKIEPAFGSEDSTLVIEFPVHIGKGVRSEKEVSLWEQLELAAFLQENWADNQVSFTGKFEPEEEGSQIAPALDYFQYKLKGLSLLPKVDNAYPQMPYEPIIEKQYHEMRRALKPINFRDIQNRDISPERFCNNDVCEVPTKIQQADKARPETKN